MAMGTSYNLDDEGKLYINKNIYWLDWFVILLVETEGVALNSLSRAELMAKLAAREPSEQAPVPVAAPIAP